MRYAKPAFIIAVALTTCVDVARLSPAQEYNKGDQVIALRDTELKAETRAHQR
jgi:hypothetical protein